MATILRNMANLTNEIESYLQHGDYNVAVRRTLDVCLDTNEDALISKAVVWSNGYHVANSASAEKVLPPNFLEDANIILQNAKAKYVTQHQAQKLITATNVAKTYSAGGFSLKPMSLSLQTGEVLGVVGENGNGKTTLLRCLAGQLALTSGSLQYHLLTNPDEYAIKNHIAFIPQRIPRWYGLLKDNLHFSAGISGVHQNKNDLMVQFMLERLNLSKFANLTWNQISSGYRTRFEIARVLLQKPRLLILDEPLANLDINAQQTILTDLVFMAKAAHNPMCIILSSQQLHEVEKVADNVLFIKNGNCLFNSANQKQVGVGNAIEFETTASRDKILSVFADGQVDLQFNGGFFTVLSSDLSAQQIIGKIVSAQIPVNYFRDITNSTKRFF
jgi:ABC-2 type transport system ATP-binding protein